MSYLMVDIRTNELSVFLVYLSKPISEKARVLNSKGLTDC